MGKRKEYSITDARMPELTERIRKIVDSNGTPTQFAKMIGASSTSVNHWYNGARTPDAIALKKIATIAGVSADYLLGLSDTPVVEENKRAACEYTGLSASAVEILHNTTNKKYIDKTTVSALFEHRETVFQLISIKRLAIRCNEVIQGLQAEDGAKINAWKKIDMDASGVIDLDAYMDRVYGFLTEMGSIKLGIIEKWMEIVDDLTGYKKAKQLLESEMDYFLTFSDNHYDTENGNGGES